MINILVLVLAFLLVVLAGFVIYLLRKLRAYKRIHEKTFSRLPSETDKISFAHMMAHDLKNPIVSAYGMVNLLESNVSGDAETLHLVGRIKHNLKKMDTLINDIMLLSENGVS